MLACGYSVTRKVAQCLSDVMDTDKKVSSSKLTLILVKL